MNAVAECKPQVTLVIGSGSVKCAAAIGVVKALSDAGIGIDRVVGCSAGAIFASLVALGYDASTSRDLTIQMWTKEITSQRNTMGLLRLLAPRLFGFRADNFGLRGDGMLLERARAVFGDRRIEDAPIPLHITATDFSNGELVDIQRQHRRRDPRQPVAAAGLRAGADARQAAGRRLPCRSAADQRGHEARQPRHRGRIREPVPGACDERQPLCVQLSAILANNLLKSRLAFHSATHHSELIMILPEFKQRVRLFDTAKVPYIIEEGEQATLQQLPYLHTLLNADRHSLAGTPA